LRSYPSIGPFLAYQYATDLNYSAILDCSEMDFVAAGPGALSGLRKCFVDLGDLSPEDTIRWICDSQASSFERLGLDFKTLFGRPLQLIDCQNLLCEIDKYARVAHPEYSNGAGRTRIKQRFKPSSVPVRLSFPPKWRLETPQVNGAT
jgi:hypothetical protein